MIRVCRTLLKLTRDMEVGIGPPRDAYMVCVAGVPKHSWEQWKAAPKLEAIIAHTNTLSSFTVIYD